MAEVTPPPRGAFPGPLSPFWRSPGGPCIATLSPFLHRREESEFACFTEGALIRCPPEAHCAVAQGDETWSLPYGVQNLPAEVGSKPSPITTQCMSSSH